MSKKNSQQRILIVAATVVLIMIVLAFRQSGSHSTDRLVVIHTDDAGMNHAVNLATIDAMERGMVSSASIMTCCPGFEEFATYATAHPEKDFGIHLTLTSEMSTFRWGPVLPRQEVSSLVDRDGTFWRSVQQVVENAQIDEVERELRAQIERARSAGITLSHLDHHMWVLYERPDLMNLYVDLGIEYDLPVRFFKQIPPEELAKRSPEIGIAFQKNLQRLRAHGFPVYDFVEAENYSIRPEDKRNYYLNQIRRLPHGVSQIVIHCAYDLPGEHSLISASRRAADTRVFMSREIEEELRRLRIRVIDCRQFRRLNEIRRNSTPL